MNIHTQRVGVNMKKRNIKYGDISLMIAAAVVAAIMFLPKAFAYDENGEVYCLAQNIYFEAGNQPLAGKVAVGNVTLNRTQHWSYPEDVCGVVFQSKMRVNWKGLSVPVLNKCQFSWFCDGKSDEPLDTKTFEESLLIARDVIDGFYPDITEGATHYHNVYVNPYWAETLNETVVINEHIFYK